MLPQTEEFIINFEKLIITTGSKPLLPGIPGIELNGVITSTDALELNEAHKNIVIIGGGVIGLEFASMLNSIGTRVIIIQLQDKKLPNEDYEIASELLKILKRQGIVFKLSSKAMETTIKNIYAAGDVTGGKLLAHLAFAEGKVAAENTLGIMSRINYNAVPSCVYTNS